MEEIKADIFDKETNDQDTNSFFKGIDKLIKKYEKLIAEISLITEQTALGTPITSEEFNIPQPSSEVTSEVGS